MSQHQNRIQKYSSVSTELTCLSNNKLSDIIENANPLHSGIGGKSVLLTINEIPVFVKKISLTDLERQPENIMSTANLFSLPLFCQYGIGSPGFSAWRELATNMMSTNWVISGQCENFPVLYHWRVLPSPQNTAMNNQQLENLEKDICFWENSNEVSNRLKAIYNSSANLVLFIEYFPNNLLTWLSGQFNQNKEDAEKSIKFVEKNLNQTNGFMNNHGLVHFDTHFENILTDGKLLYFSDFGLALSAKFELAENEIEFLALHQNYDYCRTAISLLHCISSSFLGTDRWESNIKEYLNGEKDILPTGISDIVKKYAPIALSMIEFSRKLISESKQTTYPADKFKSMLTEIKLLT